jgi:hypothetical protein
MAVVLVRGETLEIEVTGFDKVLALKSRLQVPLAHVRGVTHDPGFSRGWKGWKTAGTNAGVITAGTFHHDGDRVFWDVHDPQKLVVIELADERYRRLVIQVDDPKQTVSDIERALST